MRSAEASAPKYKAHPLKALLFAAAVAMLFGGCASGLTGYYADLRAKIDVEDYEGAAKFVDKSKGKYGKKNILLYYLDSGMTSHLARDYGQSTKKFELAKEKFAEYYQKSITAGAVSMIYNDNSMPYYGENYERVHITVFEALNYILLGEDNEAVVEARQADTMFRTFAVEKNYKNFYKDDGFIRYFMGIIYENGGYLNDAHISYYMALKAYQNGIANVPVPKDLINDAYTSALKLGMPERADEIKKEFPNARRNDIQAGYGECIIVDYNGFMPKKVDNILEFALFDIWPYINQVEVDDSKEAKEFDQARSVVISAFASDYVKVAFPKYENIPNKVKSFRVNTEDARGRKRDSYMAQNLAEVARKCMNDELGKIYAKTLARAAVKYAVGKSVSKAVTDNSNSNWGTLTQIAFNVYNSMSETADKRAWHTLPENILMTRVFLPAGPSEIEIEFLDAYESVIKTKTIAVDIKEGKKNFVVLRSAVQ